MGRNLRLRTKILLMMLSLLVVSVSALFLVHLNNQAQLLSEVRDYTAELSTAIDIAQEQPLAGNKNVVLAAYMDRLRQLGVKDISIADEEAVQASTNPANVGKPIVTKRKAKGHGQIVIKGVLGDETGPPGTQKTSNLTVPILLEDRRVGYVVITRYLDDFSNLSAASLASQIAATLVVFGLGSLISIYLSWSFTRPLQQLTRASRQVALGDLDVAVSTEGGREISALAGTFNEMVARLREQRRLEERLHFAERSTAVGRLASAVAHEIRNPLNFISLSIDHLAQKLAPSEEARRQDFDRVLTTVKAEIGRLNRLVGNFLAFGKPMSLHPRPCEVGQLVREVAFLVDHKARDQGIALDVTIEHDLPEIVADPELLKTCFLNLMINAVDAMPDGGLLSVSVVRDASSEALVVTVADTGGGMTPEEVEAAFEPYFSTKEAGVGLGLALTRKIVEDHGGRVVLESVRGSGTTGRVMLPLPAVDTAVAAARVEGQGLAL